jgi:hypothetical protein
MIIVDGEQAFKVFNPERGVINVALRWFSDNPKQDEKPAMFLYPKPHVKRQGSGAFVIPLTLAYQYQGLDLGSKKDLAVAISAAADAAKAMHLDPDRATITNICDAIFNYLPELIAMPPKRMVISHKDEQAAFGDPMGEMSIKVDGKTIHQQEITAP